MPSPLRALFDLARALLAGRRGRWLLLAAVLAAGTALSGCWLAIVSGPVIVSSGDTVTYVLELYEADLNASGPQLVAEVPAGWELQSATYEGTVNGEPVSGDGVVVQSQLCDLVLGDPRPGFRRWHLVPAGLFGGAGSGSATLEFFVESQPAGELDLRFVFGGTSFSSCSSPVAITINPQTPGFLTLLQTLFDDSPEADGLGGASDLEPSPDGRHLYVAAETDQAVAVFSRDAASGELTFVEAEFEGVGGVEGLGRFLALSPDGRHLYAGGAAFSRAAASGELTFIERFSSAAGSLAASPDGRHLYLSRPFGIEIYSRDEVSGELTPVDTVPQGDDDGLAELSPDGRHLYVWSSSERRIYARDAVSGGLTLVETLGSGGTAALALAPDGEHLYTATALGVRSFDRDPATGLIFEVDLELNVIAESVAVSPDGSHVVAAGRAGAHVYQRHRLTGELTFVGSTFTGGLPVDGLEGPAALAFAPGSRHLYALSPSDGALLAFATGIVFTDGFESGDTAVWTAAVP